MKRTREDNIEASVMDFINNFKYDFEGEKQRKKYKQENLLNLDSQLFSLKDCKNMSKTKEVFSEELSCTNITPLSSPTFQLKEFSFGESNKRHEVTGTTETC